MTEFLIVFGIVTLAIISFFPAVIPWFLTASTNRIERIAQSIVRLAMIVIFAGAGWTGNLNRGLAFAMCMIVGLITVFAWFIADVRVDPNSHAATNPPEKR